MGRDISLEESNLNNSTNENISPCDVPFIHRTIKMENILNLVFGGLVCGVQRHSVLEVVESSFPVVEGKVGFALTEPGLGTVLVLLDYLNKDKL